MTDLHYLTIAEASALIRDKKMSAVELTQACLDRIKTADDRLNAYLLVLEDQALAEAARAETAIVAGDWKGPLNRIPIGLIDIYNTAGIRTTGHSALFADHVPDSNAYTVSLLRAACAIFTGKLATWEFAIGGTFFDLPWPPARNPGVFRLIRPARRPGPGGCRFRLVSGCHGQRHRRIDRRADGMVRHCRAQADL